MAKLHSSCFIITTLLISFSFALPSFSRRSTLSLQLDLQSPSSNHLHNGPLTPYLFADQPLSLYDESSQASVQVGSAHGLYFADPAASMELCYFFCTATVRKSISQGGKDSGSLVLMGSVDSGAIAVIGGTGSFAFASGQAKVWVATGGLKSGQLSVFLDVELQEENEEGDPEIASI